VEGIQELNASYIQAGIALDTAFQKRGIQWVMSFSECVLDYMIQSATSPLLARHLVCPELLALRGYDEENKTPFYETLKQFLLLERDIPKTSETLIIHRTTLLYRLKKIQSLVHLNLEDPWTRLQLMLSLWILEKEETTDLSL
jgi:DNA-binding PucR family transcriptional regulator